MKPWSKKKRWRVALLAGGGILVVALVGGTIIYGLSRALNLTQSGSIKRQILKQAMNDPALTDAYLEALTLKSCQNLKLGYSVNYDLPLRISQDSEPFECGQFEVTGVMNRAAKVMITKRTQAKEEVVRQIIASLEAVETIGLPHPEYEVTGVWGQRDNQPYQAYILAKTVDDTFLIEYFPADAAGLAAVKEMVKTFKNIPGSN